MKGIATLLASAALMTVAGVSGAMAQDAAAAGPSTLKWNSTNVDPANPFGDIDVTAAGSTAAEVETYLAGLSGDQVIELLGRCSVITPTILANLGGPAMPALRGSGNAGIAASAQGAITRMNAMPGMAGADAGAGVAGAANPAPGAGGAAANLGGGAAGMGGGAGAAPNAADAGAQANLGNAAEQAGMMGEGAPLVGGAAAGGAMGGMTPMGGYQQAATDFCSNLTTAIFGEDESAPAAAAP
jgi:hypothetical protein